MLKKVLIGMTIVLVGFAVVVAFQPAEFSVKRSATIAAPPADVFARVNDFRNWQAWSPWARLDPKSKVAFEGSTSGKGAVFKWSGNDKVGEGSMTIVESQPARQVRIKLAFVRPFESTADTVFDFAPAGSGTAVTWTMSGRNDNLIAKAFCLVMGGPDRMIGRDFERGLAQMKTTVEGKGIERRPREGQV
jgi:Polyketide cyclase / dehydrase and lipid transport